jgi:hypothetical protein
MNENTNDAMQPITDPLHKFRGVQAFLQSCWRGAKANIGVDRDDVALAIRTLQEALDDGLVQHAIEELHQLGYTVRNGSLYPPENLAALAAASRASLVPKRRSDDVFTAD